MIFSLGKSLPPYRPRGVLKAKTLTYNAKPKFKLQTLPQLPGYDSIPSINKYLDRLQIKPTRRIKTLRSSAFNPPNYRQKRASQTSNIGNSFLIEMNAFRLALLDSFQRKQKRLNANATQSREDFIAFKEKVRDFAKRFGKLNAATRIMLTEEGKQLRKEGEKLRKTQKEIQTAQAIGLGKIGDLTEKIYIQDASVQSLLRHQEFREKQLQHLEALQEKLKEELQDWFLQRHNLQKDIDAYLEKRPRFTYDAQTTLFNILLLRLEGNVIAKRSEILTKRFSNLQKSWRLSELGITKVEEKIEIGDNALASRIN
jgi:hypothetical protein